MAFFALEAEEAASTMDDTRTLGPEEQLSVIRAMRDRKKPSPQEKKG